MGITEKILTKGNTDGLNKTLDSIKNSDADLIFTNLVDTDMLYGHRRDSSGYKKAIEEIDSYIEKFIRYMTDNDILIITYELKINVEELILFFNTSNSIILFLGNTFLIGYFIF